MELLAVCLNPFQLCMGPPDRSEEQQQQQSPTQRTRLLQFPVIECEVTQREAKALAVLLLDAEGDMFKFGSVAKGFEGGLERASSLHTRTLSYLSTRGDTALTHDIICCMLLNPSGKLANKLKGCGMEENLERFIEGFNSSPHLCFIIQCASAERKLLELLKLYSDLPACDSILFGGLHVASRAAALRALDPSARKKITLVHTVSHASVYDSLEFPITRAVKELFGELKLEKNLRGKSPTKPNGAQDGKEADRSEASSALEWRQIKTFNKEKKRSKAWEGMMVPSSVSLSEESVAHFTGDGVEEMKRSTPTSTASNGKKTKKLPSSLAPSPHSPSPIPPQTKHVPSIKFSYPHPCNEFYLSPIGCRHADCGYSHTYPFSSQEWRDYPAVIKAKVCRNVKVGGGAESCKFGARCFYGHACPYDWSDCPYGDRCHFAQAGLPHADGRIE